jgi:NAD(P)-dependent dehydrogenase (short-subunit alcohol dehydrogenase family)
MSDARPIEPLAVPHAVVTGGASGIGAAIVARLAAEGARVAVLDLNRVGAQRVADAVGGVAIEVDVRSTTGVTAAFERAAAELGGLDTVVNNAGIGNLKALHTYTEDEWDLLIDVNLKGVFNGLRAAHPLLTGVAGASIVNVASVTATNPTRGEGPYSAAKAGVVALTKSAALEFGPDIRVNCVSPGFIRTPLTEFAFTRPRWHEPLAAATPLGRAGTADDVADVVAFLCSDAARYVTGQNVVVDGGAILPNPQIDHLLGELLGPAAAPDDDVT